MYAQRTSLFAVCAVALTATLCQAAVEVKLTVTESAGVARSSGAVTSGVPFARGAVRDLGKLSVSANGRPIPAQFIKLAPWDDGSVRWALMDCQVSVPAGGKSELVVRDDGKNIAPATPVKVTASGSTVTVSNGPVRFAVGKAGGGLFESFSVDGKPLLTGAGRGLVIYTTDGKAVAAAAPSEVTVEQAGPMRAIVCAKGTFPGVHDGLMSYTVRITVHAGRKFVKLHVWLENNGAHGYVPRNSKEERKKDKKWNPGWFQFDGMAVELGLKLGDSITASCEGVKAAGAFKVLQRVRPPTTYGPAYQPEDYEYTIRGGEKELAKGNRTDGLLTLTGAAGTLTAAVRDFWQQWEKGIELADGKLRVWLWPREGVYPRIYRSHGSPGYWRNMVESLRQTSLYSIPGSVHKGHEIVLDFSGRDPKQTRAAASRPLFALASPEHYAMTEAATGLFASPKVRTGDEECDEKIDAWTRMIRSVADPKSKSSIWHARSDRPRVRTTWQIGFWYGWMDFGDLAIPGSGAVSLHYDWPWIVCTGAMRTGDARFMHLASQMVRHRVDIDQQWTDRELPRYRGLQRPTYSFAHFHCGSFTRRHPNVNENWLAGVVEYYMLTGEPKVLDAIRRNATAQVRGWERLNASEEYIDRVRNRLDMQAVARAIFSYCAMYALTAERKWLDEGLKLFSGNVVDKWKKHGPHLHDPKQFKSQGYTKDDVRYCYSIQAFCLLHHLTGDKKLFEMLKAGADTEFPENFFDAPVFLADLNAYVALKTGEQDYLDEAIELWIAGFPESKCPPVYQPLNSQWSRRKGMLMRTGHILQYAFWKKKK